MALALQVDFAAFWQSLSTDIARARQSVYVQTFSFEGDAVGLALAEVLRAAKLNDVRILVDSFTKYVLSDKILHAPHNWFDRELRAEQRATRAMWQDLRGAGIGLRFTNPPGPGLRRCLARNHKKLLVIDDNIAYLGGINFSDHNAAWHDLMLRVEDADTVRFLRDDFLATWEGKNRLATTHGGELEIHTADGSHNEQAFARVLELMDAAQETIYVASPYISFPFYEPLGRARQRGVAVQIVTPSGNNWSIFKDYAQWEATRQDLDLRFYQDGMSHLKAMLIDGRSLIIGSSNFDYLSYRIHQEIIAIVTAPDIIEDFRRKVMQPDLAAAQVMPRENQARWRNLQMTLLSKGASWLFAGK